MTEFPLIVEAHRYVHGIRITDTLSGLLGLLHLEIIQERLERDYDQAVIFTSPSVEYNCTLTNGTEYGITYSTEYDVFTIDGKFGMYVREEVSL